MDQEEFEIEKIIGKCVINGEPHFRVRWKGYSEEQDTWESEQSLEPVKSFIDAYYQSLDQNPENSSIYILNYLQIPIMKILKSPDLNKTTFQHQIN